MYIYIYIYIYILYTVSIIARWYVNNVFQALFFAITCDRLVNIRMYFIMS